MLYLVLPNMPHSKGLEKKEKFEHKENQIERGGVDSTEFFEELPTEVKEVLEVGMTMQKYSGSLPSSLASKINEKHIDKVLDLARDDSDKDYKVDLWNMGMKIFILMISISLFMFLTLYFGKTDKDLYLDLVKVIIAFLGGIGIGHGLKARKD